MPLEPVTTPQSGRMTTRAVTGCLCFLPKVSGAGEDDVACLDNTEKVKTQGSFPFSYTHLHYKLSAQTKIKFCSKSNIFSQKETDSLCRDCIGAVKDTGHRR